jgi:glyceraldehyde 3-phosphate dehydrogenase
MVIRVGINGFGRIGRLVFRAAMGNPEIEVVGLNDLTDNATLAHLLKYDSVHGTLPDDVGADADGIVIGGRKIRVRREADPAKIDWGALGAAIVVESTGRFTNRADCAKHLAGGAKKVIISAPSKDADVTIALGVNGQTYDPAQHHVVSNASCTTNCLAPVAFVLDREFGIVHGLMTTIHSYTNDQRILDFVHSDLRRARAAAVSMIPTSTGAASAIGLVLPNLKGKLDGLAIRVPTPNVSLVDLTARLKKKTTVDEVNAAFKKASEIAPLRGILGFTDLPLVSIDFNHCDRSSFIDAGGTRVIDGDFVKVLSWYDNEWGYSCRVVDLAAMMGKGL